MHQIGRTIRVRPQTPIGVRNPEILMVQSVVNIPAEAEVALLGDVEILSKRNVHIPESRRTNRIIAQTHIAELPPRIIDRRIGSGRNSRVRLERSLKRVRVEPLIFAVCFRPRRAELIRISDQIRPADTDLAL